MYSIIATRSARARVGVVLTILLLLLSILPTGELFTPTALAVGPVQYWPWIGTKGCNGTGYHWDPGAKGLDFNLRHDPVFASGTGVVHIIYTTSPDYPTGRTGPHSNGGWGNEVIIRHADGYYSRYAHLSQVFSTVGDTVIAGTPIGISGNSGNSDGPHLHYEVYRNTDSIVKDANLDAAHSVEPGPISGYENPPSNTGFCIAYPTLTNTAFGAVGLFKDVEYRGNAALLVNPLTSHGGFYDLTSYVGGQFQDKVSSIAIPLGWSVRLYKNADKSGGTGAVKYLDSVDNTFTDDSFADGTPLNDNISAVEVFVNQCVQGSLTNPKTLAFSQVAEAACGDPLPPPLPSGDGITVVAIAPINVTPGTVFNPSVTVKRTNGSLPSTAYLHAVPETSGNMFNAYPRQGVHYNVAQGNPYTFQYPEHSEFRMTAPQQTGTYQSVWRLNVNNVDVGPTIVIPITVATFSPPHPIAYWDMDVYTSKDLSGSVAYHTTTTDQYLFRDWGNSSPAGNVPVDNWSARFVREINFPGGDYHFHCQHDDGCRILIDGTTKLDAWWDASFDGHDWTGTLTPGYHEVKVEFYDQGGGAHMDVWWQGPGFLPRYPSCEPDQWCADFWGNKSLQGYPPMTKNVGTSTFLDIGWSYGGPGDNLPTDYFSARFTRTLPFACGTYRFHVTADDGERFYVDGGLKLDEWTYKAQYTTDVDVQLSGGDHSLTVDYYENTGNTAMRLSWDQLTSCASYSGDLVVNAGQTLFANTIATSVSASGTTATVGSSEGFDNGDSVLFHQTQGTANAGKWEQAVISAMDGTTWTLDHALTNAYSSSGAHAQVVKVPHYTSVTVQSGGTLTALPWNGSTGGVLMFRSDGAVTVNGTIDMTGKGYRGGEGSRRSNNHTGVQGESYRAIGISCGSQGCQTQHPNNDGGGGSGGYFAIGSGGGAGAGFGSAGTTAPTGDPIAGAVYGSSSSATLFLGSGGGGGYNDGSGDAAGNGGGGGGLIMIIAPTLQVSGAITSRGADGGSVSSYGGGGGSGGSIYVDAANTTIGTTKVTALGGSAGIATSGYSSGNGGSGGVGRIYINSCATVSGTANPAANVQQTCTSATPTPTLTPTPAAPVNLALNGDTGESSTDGVHPSSYVNDGNMSTRWASVLGHDPEWVGVDLGSVQTISSIKIYWEAAYGTNYQIQVSNDTVNWTTIKTYTNGNGGLDDFTVTGSGRYVRMYGTTRGTSWGYSIYEFEVYGPGGAPTSTPTPTATPTNTPTPTPGSGVELLTAPWNLAGSNGDDQAYEDVDPNVLAGKTMMRITYNLHGLTALGNDASAIIFDQNGWQYISLSDYGQNGLNGSQTVTIPLADFMDLDTGTPVDGIHTRFWYGSSFTVDITSIVVY